MSKQRSAVGRAWHWQSQLHTRHTPRALRHAPCDLPPALYPLPSSYSQQGAAWERILSPLYHFAVKNPTGGGGERSEGGGQIAILAVGSKLKAHGSKLKVARLQSTLELQRGRHDARMEAAGPASGRPLTKPDPAEWPAVCALPWRCSYAAQRVGRVRTEGAGPLFVQRNLGQSPPRRSAVPAGGAAAGLASARRSAACIRRGADHHRQSLLRRALWADLSGRTEDGDAEAVQYGTQSPGTLDGFVAWLQAEPWGKARVRRRSLQTALKNYRHLRAIAAYAAQLELMPPLAALRFPDSGMAEEEHDVPALTIEELQRICDAARAVTGEIGGIRASAWWTALLLVLWNTGLRITATLKLRWQDYDPARRTVTAWKNTQKQKKTQCLGITPQTARCLEKIRGERERIFPWPFDPSGNLKTLDRRFRQDVLGPAGVADVRGKLFHRLREGLATELKILEEEGAVPARAATAQLGHSSEAVTDKSYIAQRAKLRPTRHGEALAQPKLADLQSVLFDKHREQ